MTNPMLEKQRLLFKEAGIDVGRIIVYIRDTGRLPGIKNDIDKLNECLREAAQITETLIAEEAADEAAADGKIGPGEFKKDMGSDPRD